MNALDELNLETVSFLRLSDGISFTPGNQTSVRFFNFIVMAGGNLGWKNVGLKCILHQCDLTFNLKVVTDCT